jgi:transcriptional regulator of acetoin/glycerol metabolism
MTEAEWRHAHERVGALAHAAQSRLDRLDHIVRLGGCCVMLADTAGVAIEWRGLAGDEADLRRLGLIPGATWSESVAGTNGIGTCLVEKRPLSVQGDEHFFITNGSMSCVAAPVFDHRGQMAAVINISVYGNGQDGVLLGYARMIASETAAQIQEDHFRQSFPRARIVLLDEKHRSGFLAVDGDDLVVGASAAARGALRISDADIAAGIPARDLLEGAVTSRTDLDETQRAALRRALARAKGNVSRAAFELGVSRATLKRKLSHYGVRPRDG